MNANYSKLLTKVASIAGITGASLLFALPSQAIEQETFQSKTYIAQNLDNGILNPRPSIFNEPPYNGRRPGVTPPRPVTPPPMQRPPQRSNRQNVIEVAKSAGNFTMLVKALEAGGLTEILQGEGPFTIFAPTDEAFAKLPQDAVRDLLKPENKAILVKILTYHVVPGKVMSSDLQPGEVNSVQGDPITVKMSPNQGVFVNDGKVTKADIPASNGVIHIINNLILPPSL